MPLFRGTAEIPFCLPQLLYLQFCLPPPTFTIFSTPISYIYQFLNPNLLHWPISLPHLLLPFSLHPSLYLKISLSQAHIFTIFFIPTSQTTVTCTAGVTASRVDTDGKMCSVRSSNSSPVTSYSWRPAGHTAWCSQVRTLDSICVREDKLTTN